MNDNKHFHEGEAHWQSASGVDTEAFERGVAQAFLPELSDNEAGFVSALTFSVAASIDQAGRPWASPLFASSAGLFSVIERTIVAIRPHVAPGDPLIDNIAETGELGVLYFDPSRRRRAKSLGKAGLADDGTIMYRMHRNFGLCTKYIFKRQHTALGEVTHVEVGEPAAELGEADIDQLTKADTIFFASLHRSHGADATHRGGPPGFVSVVDNSTLHIPDYVGNGMFNTLGNLLLDNRFGLLSIDFETGRCVQLTGTAAIVPSPHDDVMAQRTLEVAIDEVLVTHAASGTWVGIEEFAFRPGLINPATPMLG